MVPYLNSASTYRQNPLSLNFITFTTYVFKMKPSQLYFTQLALVGSAIATQYGPVTGSGYGPSQSGTPDFLTLNHDPQASKSERLTSGWGISVECPEGKPTEQTLTWRINITEAAVPDASNASGPIPNARMLNTVYDLSWQGDDNLQDTMSAIQRDAHPSRNVSQPPQLCATIFTAVFPANITNAYNESSQDSCIGAFGDCLGPLLFTGEAGPSGCPTVKDPSAIPACDGVFENSGDPATLDLTQAGTGAPNASFPLLSGNGFFFQSSEAYEEGNTTFFDQQNSRLHVMILDTVNSTTRAVCSRVNASIETKDMDTGASDDTGAAGVGSSVSFWLMAMAAFGVSGFLL